LGPGGLVGAALAGPSAAAVSSMSHPLPGSLGASPIDPVGAGGAPQLGRTSSNSGVMGVVVEGVPAMGVPVGAAGGGVQQMEGVVLQQQQQQPLVNGAMSGVVSTSAGMMLTQVGCE
jgi:hypothetical protein